MEPIPETYRGISLKSCEVDPNYYDNGTCIYENDYAIATVSHSMTYGWGIISFKRKKMSEAQKEKYNNPPNILESSVTRRAAEKTEESKVETDLANLIKPEENEAHDVSEEKFSRNNPY